jgi:hypothetical protein
MLGTTAKGGRFFYYGCQSYLKRGRTACEGGLISRAMLEDYVMDTLRDEVLTEKNLSELAGFVNEEKDKARRSARSKVAEVEAQVKGLQARLDRLYEELETGHVELEGGTLMERKAWLRTWLKRVEVDRSREGFVEFIAPFMIKREGHPKSGGLQNASVLSMEQNGSASRTLVKTETAYFMSFRSG